MKVLVTGASGFLGSHLVEMLLERGDEVRALLLPVELPDFARRWPAVESIAGDLREESSLQQAVHGVQRVYHLAARTGPWGPEALYQEVNVLGLARLVEAALAAGVEGFVHTSSITVYGHFLHGLVDETQPFHAEDNPYSRSKIAGEQLLARLVSERQAPVSIVRPGWIYGPGDVASFARFAALIEAGRGFLLGSGQNILPLVYVRDVAQGLLKAGEAANQSPGRAYTLVNDQRVTQAAYFNAIAACLNVAPVERHVPFWPLYAAGRTAEIMLHWRKTTPPPLTTYGITLAGNNQVFSCARARQELGYEPHSDLLNGVAASVRWYQTNKDARATRPHVSSTTPSAASQSPGVADC